MAKSQLVINLCWISVLFYLVALYFSFFVLKGCWLLFIVQKDMAGLIGAYIIGINGFWMLLSICFGWLTYHAFRCNECEEKINNNSQDT